MRRGQIGRRDDGAVPITAEHRVVDAESLDDMHQVIGDRRDGRSALREEAALVHHADGAAGIGDGPELLVCEISPMRIDGVYARMGHERRLRRIMDFERIKKSLSSDMREVDEDLSFVELANVIAAKLREAISSARKAERRARLAKVRVEEVNERDAEDAEFGDEIEIVD